ncbi:MAG TPA: S8 family serine peptidase [Actinoplanes sp.]|nr:S8 family serine peptidase [Actinoplanes sp.]
MKLLSCATGGVLAAATVVFVLAPHTPEWTPVSYGLTTDPEAMLPPVVSAEEPARVVSTVIDADGRPVVTVSEAVDKAAAVELVKDAQQVKGAVSVEMDAPVQALGSDPYRSQQWDLSRMRVAEAWTKATGAGVVVAVVDTGVDANHPDLRGNVLSGYDAVTNRAGTSRDGNGHGTHVAGTIAALTGNDVGVSAVAPDARILPVKVLSDSGSGSMADAAEGIVWAADNGAQIINMSLGGTTKVAAVSNAIAYARGKGVTVVAAAGNERAQGSPVSYPGADAGVIAVAATDSTDKVAAYSNAGSHVDVAAPGSAIWSTYPTALGKSYAQLSGTSMAAPHVAAAAALLKSLQPRLTPDQIESALKTSAVDLGPKGFDEDYGYGRIDAVAALNVIAPPASASPSPSVTSAKPRLNPLITTNVTSREVAYGSNMATTFTVRVGGSPWANKPVQLCADDICTDVRTTGTGTVSVSRTATAGVKLQVRMTETDTTQAAMSPVAVWTVRVKVAASVSRGVMTVTIGGATGQPVQVQQLSANRQWEPAGTFDAVPRTTISGLRARQQYRVVVADSAGLLGAAGNTVTG